MTDRPTRELGLPRGCIGSTSLRELADALERLTDFHDARRGAHADRPCLRRIESQGDLVVAYVSTGPDIGGTWIRFALGPHGWAILDDHEP